ncbi:TraB/GumN family protein [Alteromonas sp. ASW11-36]|uniref:TraB/GumN family protein n=1 Tax=Alteromonas arenosi TaxID=3055817 RepID=A0ABT7SVQ1_9ALTE|nr:TraB/GumN family protein [Alteromonas sp. ASW11-36]MDM7860272.1 TraB/GumN family protein [Alteromonas sp. ASW11-36]
MKRIVLFAVFFCLSQLSHAASVWKVSNGKDTVYVGGTIHMLSETDYPLPKEYSRAYQASHKVILETDVMSLDNPEFLQKMIAKVTYQDGRTFRDELSPQVSKAVEQHLLSRGIPPQSMLPYKPSFLSISIALTELKLAGLTAEGIDEHFAKLATSDGKPIGWLESLDQQLEFLANLGKGQEDELLLYTLDDISTLGAWLEEFRTQWLAGDMNGLSDSQIVEMKRDFPAVYKDLLVERNHNWIPQIKAMFNTPEIEFVLVGTLHLAGPDSVLTMLEQAGYTVEKL